MDYLKGVHYHNINTIKIKFVGGCNVLIKMHLCCTEFRKGEYGFRGEVGGGFQWGISFMLGFSPKHSLNSSLHFCSPK